MLWKFCIAAALSISTVYSDCALGWDTIISGEKCLRGYEERMTFEEALRYCERAGAGDHGTLVSIHNAFQNAQVAALIEGTHASDGGWIGLRDFEGNGNYSWTDGTSLSYKNWNGELPFPDNKTRAAYLDTTLKNKWMTTSEPTDKMCFVCERSGESWGTTTVAKTTTSAAKITTTTTETTKTTTTITATEAITTASPG